MKRIRILIVDESVICRDALGKALSDVADVELLGTAPNGKTGLSRLGQTEVDLLVLSAGIRDPDAAQFTRQAFKVKPDVGVLLTTHQDARDAAMVIETLEAGAFDFTVKPAEGCPEELEQILKRRLLPKIRVFSTALYSRLARSLSSTGIAAKPTRPVAEDSEIRAINTLVKEKKEKRALPADFPLPVVAVVHMPEEFTVSLARNLNERSQLTVNEARDGEELQPGRVYLAPGGRHLLLDSATRGRLLLRTSDDPPENGCRPAVNVLFCSAVRACPNGVLALIMTGMGDDGVKGLAALKQAGAHVLAQDEASSVVWGMPGSAVRAGVVDEVVPLDRLARRVLELAGGSP
jgi:two-component system chemotaxis response regulator CheB